MPKIDNWIRAGDRLIGEVSDHDRQEEFTGSTQITSRIIEINEEEKWCQTENTLYKLGNKDVFYAGG